jgi:hypothetical protein
MREIQTKQYCKIPTVECMRDGVCKSAERCRGYNDCGHLENHVNYPQIEGAYDYCGDCTQKYYICPKLILVCE